MLPVASGVIEVAVVSQVLSKCLVVMMELPVSVKENEGDICPVGLAQCARPTRGSVLGLLFHSTFPQA